MKSTWKAHERAIARRLHGQRSGATGKKSADVVTRDWSIECKLRAALPAWLTDAMQQAQHNATPGTRALLILHETGTHHDGDLVVMRLATFEELQSDKLSVGRRIDA